MYHKFFNDLSSLEDYTFEIYDSPILQDFIVKVKYDVIFKVDEFGQVISLKAFQLDTSLWCPLAIG